MPLTPHLIPSAVTEYPMHALSTKEDHYSKLISIETNADHNLVWFSLYEFQMEYSAVVRDKIYPIDVCLFEFKNKMLLLSF